MTLVLLGSSGQLGRAFVEHAREQNLPIVAYDKAEVDFLRPETMEFPLASVRAVINCAAYTNVDRAETDEGRATQINADAVGLLARRCADAGTTLIHYSTDYVFDGKASAPYPVDHPHAPINAYGRSKSKGEQYLAASGADHLLIRTSWVYAPWGNNFVRTMARLMAEKGEVRVVDDQRGRPTHVSTLVERSLALLDGGHRGTFHITDSGECTWYGFATAIRDALGAKCRVLPCSTMEFPRPARRPAYSVLDTSSTDEVLGEASSYFERLSQTVTPAPQG